MDENLLKEIDPNQEIDPKVIEEKLFSRNFTKWGLDMNPVVSIGVAVFIFLFTSVALIDLETTTAVLNNIKASVLDKTNWLFIFTSNIFVILGFFLALSKYGTVTIGGVDAKPKFSNFSWYSMLLSAGMGIGLMFYSVGEPLIHANVIPPVFNSGDTATTALAATYLHWGIHPWSLYAIVALALAFYSFNKKLPLSLRSVFYPVFKDKVYGPLGDIIDLLTVIACLFGLAASLGVGAQQVNSGLNYVFGIPINTTVQVILIALITGAATMSVVTGLDKGVKILSRLNIQLAIVFMVLILLIGPTGYILESFANSLGLHINDLVKSSFHISTEQAQWQSSWTIFYLAWWISWSPFVGIFIARISVGRTVREFLLAVMIIPSFVSFIWMSVFGSTATYINQVSGGALFDVVNSNLPVALFELITYLDVPFMSEVIQLGLSILGLVLIVSFFVTSSDSGSLVVDNITSGGKLDSPVPQRVFWACMEGLIAAVLLMIGGSEILGTLQTALISTGLPFSIILLAMAFILLDQIKQAYRKQNNIRSYRTYKKFRKRFFAEQESKGEKKNIKDTLVSIKNK